MDPDYEPCEMELRTLYGLKMEQKRNDAVVDAKMFENITSKNKEVGIFLVFVVNLWMAFSFSVFFVNKYFQARSLTCGVRVANFPNMLQAFVLMLFASFMLSGESLLSARHHLKSLMDNMRSQ